AIATGAAEFGLGGMEATKHGTDAPVWEPATPLPAGLAKKLAGRWESDDGRRKLDLYERDGRLWVWPLRGALRTELKMQGKDLVVDDRLGLSPKIGIGKDYLTIGQSKLTRKHPDKPALIP